MTLGSFTGVLVPALTPFKADLSPDRERFLAHLKWLLRQGADGLAIFGTTSEANSMSVEEKIELLDYVIAGGIPPARLMPGTGCCALTDSVRLTRHAAQQKCGGVLMLPPFFYKGVSDAGLFAKLDDEQAIGFAEDFQGMKLFRRAFGQLGEIVESELDWADELAFFPTDFGFTDDLRQRALDAQLDRAAVIPAHPAGEFENFVGEQRLFADDVADFFQLRMRRRLG